MKQLLDTSGANKHDQIIGALSPRNWLSESTTFLENVWVINTSRKGQERAKEETIRFDTPIKGWPELTKLDDPALM